MRNAIARVNQLFVLVVLIVFYVLFVGIAWLLYRLFKPRDTSAGTYWTHAKKGPLLSSSPYE